ncbi:hypothetical protein [Acidovorax sp.]|uniref:hypothetical protein n=1 Tax=Acidovorax sp. TaxID=1872122 RepID=UPI002ACE433C|nr:hypothetical protein [Acidovorax sp.]MDZ7863248.1 hypothetical protein [Acidovorax sp.]
MAFSGHAGALIREEKVRELYLGGRAHFVAATIHPSCLPGFPCCLPAFPSRSSNCLSSACSAVLLVALGAFGPHALRRSYAALRRWYKTAWHRCGNWHW